MHKIQMIDLSKTPDSRPAFAGRQAPDWPSTKKEKPPIHKWSF